MIKQTENPIPKGEENPKINKLADSNWDDDIIIDFYKKQVREICHELAKNPKRKTELSKNTNFILRNARYIKELNKNKNKKLNYYRLTHKKLNDEQKNESTKLQSFKTKDNNDSVINMLFPYVNEDDFKMEKFKTGEDLLNDERLKIGKIPIIKLRQERKIRSNFMRKYKKYDKDLSTYASKPTIRCSSAYLTEDQRRRREFLKSKEYWVSSNDFKRYFNNNNEQKLSKEQKLKRNKSMNLIPSEKYIGQFHQQNFRLVDRTKWLSKRGFVI